MGYESAPTVSNAVSGDYSILSFIVNVLLVAILPAVCEETTHRGLLLKGLSSLGIRNSVIISSLLFGLMHLNINQFFYATVLGFVIALTVIISKNIFPAIIIHFMNNFLSVFFDFAYLGKPIIFYQFDEEKFRRGQYLEGYFNYKNNPLSSWANNLSDLLTLIDANKNNMSTPNTEQAKKYFKYIDTNNSQRIYEEIKNGNKRNSNKNKKQN